MSAGYPSKKEKRPRSSNDVNKSFVKNVTSRMSGLLPSSITKWFGSPSSSNTNGSAPVAESSDSSTEDEATDNPIAQPPSKRMRFSSPSLPNVSVVPETKSTGTNTESTETFSVVNSATGRSKFRPETISTPVPSSTEAKISERGKDTAVYKSQNSSYSTNQSIVKKRKSLFDVTDDEKTSDKLQRSNSVLDLRQPYFKPALFGSPFYPGQTRYGGAASSYMNKPNIKTRKDTLINQPANNDNVNISHATRRVMDLLENYSSPLIEAKRISQFVRSPNSLDNSLSTKGYKTEELHVPSIAKTLRLKQKSRLMDTTSAARQLIASNSSSLSFTPSPSSKSHGNIPNEKSDKLTTKMKTKITRINRDDTAASEIDGSAIVPLPTAVLQIDHNNLPKFTLGASVSSCVSKRRNLEKPTANSTTGTTTTATSTMPISTTKLMKRDPVPKNITEIAYRRTIEESKDKESLNTGNKKAETQSQTWNCDDCWVSNKSGSHMCVCCGAKKPASSESKPKCCSCCKVVPSQKHSERCIDCEMKIDKVAKSLTKIIEASKWKCQDCLVSNVEGVDKCVCCGGKKSQEVGPVANSKSADIASDWKCEVCLIKNKSIADKCVACDATKPTPKQSDPKDKSPKSKISKPPASNDSSFKKIINLQSDKWECSNCLVRNDKDRSKCLCCDTENPSKIKESEKNSFNFSTHNTTFKFGIEPAHNVSEKKAESFPVTRLGTTVKESETNNNIVTKPASFTFGTSKPKSCAINITEKETKAEGTPKPTFKFGVSKPMVSSAPTTSNLFRNPIETGTKLPQIIQPKKSPGTDEKVQEVPNIEEFNKTALPNTQKLVGIFGISSNTSAATTAPVSRSFGQMAKTPAGPSVSTTAVDAKVPQSTFTFSASSIKPGSQLFSAVTTASTVPAIQAPSTSSTSMFQKREPASPVNFFSKTDSVPSSLTLFDKNDSITTSAAPSSLPSAPVFSFRANTTNIQTEKPKFNFTFGSSSEPTLFNLPTSNTGNTLSGNGLPSSHATSGNIVSGGNGLATGGTVVGTSHSSNSGLLGGPAKKENIMWSSNQLDSSIKMSPGNNAVQGVNNLPAIQSGNPFSVQAKEDNTWSLNQNTPTDNIKSTPLPTGNNVDPANNVLGAASGSRIFGAPEKKENMWSNNSNMFASNAGASNLQKPGSFSFGSSMQFDSNNVTPAPTFGSLAQPTQNLFGMSSQVNNNQPDMFSSTLQSQAPSNMFGGQTVNNNSPSVGMFGTINTGATPSFGTPNSTISTFEVAPLNSVPTPTFNFGAQQTTGVFGFGQQQAQSQGAVYNFGAQASASPQRQFNIGTAGGAPNAMGRRPIRRAVRRTNQR
ncbi:nuclear pore complex protein Nup153 isoform X2 [Pararge aegeria]|uniref:nuclear pore complex protein Nup153 isoform X2 n=1 Tax=Pararge aegeria TaxID=116150 RepID=UPI0019D2DD73|nr:nuclear pore complex protein Nup153 isoform X2 [Pararge aegeria]